MDRYYDILGLPLTATQEEIKNQYKQLVRLYHPDLYQSPQDKALAEEKFKAINEAYGYLHSYLATAYPLARLTVDLNLRITPTLLDFGSLPPNASRMRKFQVSFDEGIAENADFVCSEDDSWFKVVRVSHLYAADHSALEFDVEVKTRNLAPQTYQGWIDVYLNGALARMPLSLEVMAARHQYRYSLLAIAALLLAVLLVGPLAFTYSNSLTASQPTPLLENAQSPLASSQQLSFSLAEQQGLAIYMTEIGGEGEGPRALGVNGRGAVGNVAGQQVAYLDNKGEVTLLSLASGARTVVTADGEPKTALRWSPAGTHLAYLAGSEEQRRLVVYTLATGLRRELPGQATTGVSHYAWSPDGSTLAIDLWQGTARRVYRMAVDGSGLQPLTRFDSWGAAWSADGRSLVVSAADGLYRLDSGGRTATQVSAVQGEAPSWSADGQWLAYLTNTADGQTLWVMALASGETTAVSTESVSYAWSPVGAVLGYVTGRMTAATPLLYLWTVTPGQAPTLVAEINDPLFQWTQ